MWTFQVLVVALAMVAAVMASEDWNGHKLAFRAELDNIEDGVLNEGPIDYNVVGNPIVEPGVVDGALSLINEGPQSPIMELVNASQYAVGASVLDNACFNDMDCPDGFTFTAWAKLTPRGEDVSGCNYILGTDDKVGMLLGILDLPGYFLVWYVGQATDRVVRIYCWYPNANFHEEWTFYTVSADGPFADNTTYKMYLDGEEQTMCTVSNRGYPEDFSLPAEPNNKIYIGATELPGLPSGVPVCGFHGQIDDVKGYDELLPVNAIEKEYKKTKPAST